MDDLIPDNLSPDADDLTAPDEHDTPLKHFFVDLFKVLILGAFAVVFIRYFIFKPFIVKGGSMLPNYQEGEYLIIDELSYHLGSPRRGETVVVRTHEEDREYFLKRVIGLPKERVVIAGGRIKIYNARNPDGFYLDEHQYLGGNVLTDGRIDVTLGSSDYYVLGDNRSQSLDSRRIGPIARRDIIGRAFVRGWPIYRTGYLIEQPYATEQ